MSIISTFFGKLTYEKQEFSKKKNTNPRLLILLANNCTKIAKFES